MHMMKPTIIFNKPEEINNKDIIKNDVSDACYIVGIPTPEACVSINEICFGFNSKKDRDSVAKILEKKYCQAE